MEIVIREYRDSDLLSLNELLKDVYDLEKSCSNIKNIEIVAVLDNQVIGYLTINRLYDSVKDIKYAFLNYVCVDKNYRKMGIASNMLNYAFDICKKIGIKYIELTSNASRLEAQELYKNNGFVVRETNVFRKEIL